jgi:hypothetical protein
MAVLVPLTLFGYIPFVLFLFVVLPPRRAVVWSFLIAWLFLPMAGYKVPALPDYTKMSATVFGVLLGASIFDADRLFGFRPKWVDLPVLLFCCCPMATSVVNGLGVYDGCSEILRALFAWGLPYFIGRIYFNDLDGIRELAVALFMGGLIYVPLCWFEIRFSPQLHRIVYGFFQHSFAQEIRDGGFRPMVFMQHGLMVGMWMAMTGMIGVWLWRSKTIRRVWDMPMYLLVPVLLFTAYECKSKGALLILLIGLTALFTVRWVRIKTLMVLLLLSPLVYMYLRADGAISGDRIVQLAHDTFGEDRAQSLKYRFDNENILAKRAMEQPWFGWGGWDRSSVVDDNGKYIVTDSLFIITLGRAGWVGLIGLYLMLELPMFLVLVDWKVEQWTHPALAPVVVLGMMSALYMFDHLMNGMINPIFMLAVGAVTSAHYLMPMRAAQNAWTPPQRPLAGAPPTGAQPAWMH